MADPTSLAGLQLRTDRELAASAERLARHFKIDPPDYGPKRMDVRKQNIGRAEGTRTTACGCGAGFDGRAAGR